MKCSKCGYDSENDFRFCPECGQITTTESTPVTRDGPTAAVRTEQPAGYIREDFDPARDASQPVRVNPAAVPYAGPAQQTWPAQVNEPAKRQPTTGMIVMSIINMLCCGLGLGFVLGLIALILSIMAAGDDSAQEAESKLRVARILNIIGIVLIVVQIIIVILSFAGFFIFSRSITTSTFPFDQNFGNDFPFYD